MKKDGHGGRGRDNGGGNSKKRKSGERRVGGGEVRTLATAAAGRHASHAFGPWETGTAKPVPHSATRWLMDEKAQGTVLKVVDWNTLADAYTFAHFYKHLDNAASTLAWSKRSKMIYATLQQLGGDIVCLQEIDAWGEVQSVMAGMGYDGVFQRRTGTKEDGLAILWLRDKLAPIGKKEILQYNATLGKEGEDRVALRVCLEVMGVPGRRVTVATTHLDYKRPRMQTEMCRLFAQFVLDARREARDLIVACGDFNTEMDSEAVRLFVENSKLASALPLCDPLGHPVFTACIKDPKNIDHLFYDERFARVVGIVAPLMSTARLPHDMYPSDHLLVGAALLLTDK